MRVVAVATLTDLVPLYPLYPLLFADHGLSTAVISSLFVLWAATTLVLEVPSGAWADAWSRRGMLVLSAVLAAAAFGAWVLVPSYPVFAAGFVVWGVAGALSSGTLEALTYDELARRGATAGYARLMGRTRAGGLAAIVVASAAAAPLVEAGGYLLVGGVTVVVGLVTAAVAATLPEPPRGGDDADDAGSGAEGAGGPFATWWAMLASGLAETTRDAVVRRAVLVAALVTGLIAFDEYLPLLAAEGGASPSGVALLMAAIGVVEVVGAALGGRCAGWRPGALAALLAGAGVVVGIGALLPLGPAFVAIAVGYGVFQLLIVVLDARVQDAVTGRARATVTSVSGLGAEAVAIAVVATVGVGSVWATLPILLAALMLPVLAAATVLARSRT